MIATIIALAIGGEAICVFSIATGVSFIRAKFFPSLPLGIFLIIVGLLGIAFFTYKIIALV